MLGFLDAGPLGFPLLVPQRESHREDLDGRDGETREGGAVILGCRRKEKRTGECGTRATGSPWSELVLARTAACILVGPC